MSSAEKDRLYLQAGIQELSDYLLSRELYWPLSSRVRGVELPRLTTGGLLLAKARLRARSISPSDQPVFASLEQQLEVIHSKWRVAWEHKAAREVHARLGLWQNYLTDYRHAPEQYADAYPQEVRWRVMLQLLMDELPAPPPEQAALAQLDGLLRVYFLPGGFIWETDLVSVFPKDEYWFLYGKLKA